MHKFLRAFTLSSVITFLVVFGSSAFVFLQLEPKLLFTDTLTAGGDMGAHVWLPWFLKNHLLSHGRISGWTPDWYNGFPALTFYFPLPAMLVALLSFVIPYGIAFKLVTVSGVISMPISAWAFGKLSRLPFPVPACLAAAMVPFLFDTGYTILGGNIASTLAGEFAFSIGLSLAMVFLGLVAGGLETNKRRGWAALLFGAIILSHILPTIFALVGGIVLTVTRMILGGTLPGQRKADEIPTPSMRRINALRITVAVGVSSAATSVLFGLFALTKGQSAGYFFFALVAVLVTALVLAFCAPNTRREVFSLRPADSESARWSALKWAVAVGVVGGLVSGFWALPFVFDSHYMNDMGWEKIGTGTESGMKLFDQKIVQYTDALFPKALSAIIVGGFLGAMVALFNRRRMGIFWVIMAVISAVAFIEMPQGRLWNARLLPFYYLSLYMLTAYLISEIGWSVAAWVRRTRNADYAEGFEVAAPLLAFALAMAIVVPKLPPPDWWPSGVQKFLTERNVAIWHDPKVSGASFVPAWATWNYSGYDGVKKTALGDEFYKPSYPEYQSVLDMLRDVGKQRGCGRVMWEYESELDRFGTPMALMLTPMHTNDCMLSEEGLFFESSATVPYHFLNQALLSKSPSSAMRDLPYGSLNVADGVTRLQMLGVKYYLAVSPEAQQQAALDPRLTLVATRDAAAAKNGAARTWNLYDIADADLVAPLVNLPTVITDPASIPTRRDDKAASEEKLSYREAWLENSLDWYQDPSRFATPLASDGPKEWPRITNATEATDPVPVADPARITRISNADDRISFHVENTGSPVVVRTSYFPNWKVDGAKGVYRLTPNLMVVVPTKNDVTLHYGRTPVDITGIAMTIAGLFGVAWLMRRDRLIGDLPVVAESSGAGGGPSAIFGPDVVEKPHLVTVESSADGTNAEVLEIHSPPEEPKSS